MRDLWVVTCNASNDGEYEDYICINDEFKGIFDSLDAAVNEVQKIVDWYKTKHDEDSENHFGSYNKEEIDGCIIISFSASTKDDWYGWDYGYEIKKVETNFHFADPDVCELEKSYKERN